MTAVLPLGILFRGNKEGAIRAQLIEKNWIHAVIGLPENLFQNTAIPVCLIVLQKNRTRRDILFIDAADGFEKQKNTNRMTDAHVQRIVNAYRTYADEERFARVVSHQEIRDNEYNLNIPRYVDISVPEPVQDLNEIMDELLLVQQQIDTGQRELLTQMRQLRATNPAEQAELDRAVGKFALFVAPPESVHAVQPDIDIKGLMAQTEHKIEQLQAMKKYFLQRMFV